ncbi:unnamed protein product [Gordionus sp. m RMFG-2023]|uniref:synaptobrevin homolog YKT6-like n=1 Tax=Gordionus sp. m RMFG-2023 TaxID=3053472 RepID=UPI0030E09EFA
MKLYGIFILVKISDFHNDSSKNAKIIKYALNLASFNFFQRRGVEEFLKFTSELLITKTQQGSRCTITQDNYLCNTYVRSDDKLGAILFSDHEYPKRVAQTLLTKVLNNFSNQSYENNEINKPMIDPFLTEMLAKYQSPKEADVLTRLENDLDETKIILHNTIESVLERGEKLDDLVSKSDQLSADSKAFYRTARKTNQCSCII